MKSAENVARWKERIRLFSWAEDEDKRSDALQRVWLLLSVCHRECMCVLFVLFPKLLLHTLPQQDLKRSTSLNNEASSIYWQLAQWTRSQNEILTLHSKRGTNKRLTDELITMNKWHKAKQKKASPTVEETNVEIITHFLSGLLWI